VIAWIALAAASEGLYLPDGRYLSAASQGQRRNRLEGLEVRDQLTGLRVVPGALDPLLEDYEDIRAWTDPTSCAPRVGWLVGDLEACPVRHGAHGYRLEGSCDVSREDGPVELLLFDRSDEGCTGPAAGTWAVRSTVGLSVVSGAPVIAPEEWAGLLGGAMLLGAVVLLVRRERPAQVEVIEEAPSVEVAEPVEVVEEDTEVVEAPAAEPVALPAQPSPTLEPTGHPALEEALSPALEMLLARSRALRAEAERVQADPGYLSRWSAIEEAAGAPDYTVPLEGALVPWLRLAQFLHEALPVELPEAMAPTAPAPSALEPTAVEFFGLLGLQYEHVPLYGARLADFAVRAHRVSRRRVAPIEILGGLRPPAAAGGGAVVRVEYPLIRGAGPRAALVALDVG